MQQQPSTTTTYLSDGSTVVTVSGDIDMTTTADLSEHLTAAVESATPPQAVVADLRNVGFLASCGMQVLVDIHQRCTEQQTPFRVVITSPTVRRPLELVGLDKVLALISAPDEAPDAITADAVEETP